MANIEDFIVTAFKVLLLHLCNNGYAMTKFTINGFKSAYYFPYIPRAETSIKTERFIAAFNKFALKGTVG